MEDYRWLAGVIAAHPGHQLVGRTRLQKTIRLLQRIGAPTTYRYSNYFYGPFSEAVQADVKLAEAVGLVREENQENKDGVTYYVFKAEKKATIDDIEPFRKAIDKLNNADAVVLELAATYDAFRELGSSHQLAIEQLRRKKGSNCEEGRLDLALRLLKDISLRSADAAS